MRETFVNIATASGDLRFRGNERGHLQSGHDRITVNGDLLIAEAKRTVLELAEAGYTMPMKAEVEVLGRTGLGTLIVGSHAFRLGNYAGEHDQLIANKIAYVMCGGDLSRPQKVNEQYL